MQDDSTISIQKITSPIFCIALIHPETNNLENNGLVEYGDFNAFDECEPPANLKILGYRTEKVI